MHGASRPSLRLEDHLGSLETVFRVLKRGANWWELVVLVVVRTTNNEQRATDNKRQTTNNEEQTTKND